MCSNILKCFTTVTEDTALWAIRAQTLLNGNTRKCAPKPVSTFGGEDQNLLFVLVILLSSCSANKPSKYQLESQSQHKNPFLLVLIGLSFCLIIVVKLLKALFWKSQILTLKRVKTKLNN